MVKNNKQETRESGKMLALTLALTNFLLLVVVVMAFWLVQVILSEGERFILQARGFNFS